MLNLFYREPDGDRWFPYDRIPRRFIRRVRYGPRRPGGQERVFLNLCLGLDRLGIPYNANNLRYARGHPEELCCILGKRQVLDTFGLPNPLMVGPCCYDHAIDAPDLASRAAVRRILVPGEWMRRMCEALWGDRVFAWPVGIDTDLWAPEQSVPKTIDFILYNKIRWDHAYRESNLLEPLRTELRRRNLTFSEVKYGSYKPDQYRALLSTARAMIFVCEHETQGIAYQEALASGVPILAWDHGGEWLDPSYHPDRVRYGPISSVPYWDSTCGEKFADVGMFSSALERFQQGLAAGTYSPRDFILTHLELKAAARAFVAHAEAASRRG
jgi:glycosyltransferase involved in cell wall biosynthesis